MNADTIRAVLRRLLDLERLSVRYRQGVVTDTAPLSVALGGADVPYTSVRTLTAGLQVGDVVSVLTFGNDLIVLGRIGGTPAVAQPATRTVRVGSVQITAGTFTIGPSADSVEEGELYFDPGFSTRPHITVTALQQDGTTYPDAFAMTVRGDRPAGSSFVWQCRRVDAATGWDQQLRASYVAVGSWA